MVPLIDTNMIVEYSHRILAAIVTVMVALLALFAWRQQRDNRPLVRDERRGLRPDHRAGIARRADRREGTQGGAGGDPPRRRDAPDRARCCWSRGCRGPASERRPERTRPATTRAITVLSVAAAVLVLATIVAGGYMAAGQLEGTGREHAATDAHMACGRTSRPATGASCRSARAARWTSTSPTARSCTSRRRRSWRCSSLVLAQRRRLDPDSARRLTLLSGAAVGVLAGQVLLGALNVWLGEHEELIVAHLTVGTMLWITLALFTMRALDVRQHGARAKPVRQARRGGARLMEAGARARPAALGRFARLYVARELVGRLRRAHQAACHLAAAGDDARDDVRRRPQPRPRRDPARRWSAATSPPGARARSTTTSSATSTRA